MARTCLKDQNSYCHQKFYRGRGCLLMVFRIAQSVQLRSASRSGKWSTFKPRIPSYQCVKQMLKASKKEGGCLQKVFST